jgi:hypothetical protein
VAVPEGLSGNELVVLSIQASDGIFSASSEVKVTVRDVNNNAPKFERESYVATVQEDAQIGKCFFSQYNKFNIHTLVLHNISQEALFCSIYSVGDV